MIDYFKINYINNYFRNKLETFYIHDFIYNLTIGRIFVYIAYMYEILERKTYLSKKNVRKYNFVRMFVIITMLLLFFLCRKQKNMALINEKCYHNKNTNYIRKELRNLFNKRKSISILLKNFFSSMHNKFYRYMRNTLI